MAILVVCENEKEFDAALGSMVHCDASFSCPDEFVGRIVKCPGCHQPIRIGSSNRHVSSKTGKPVADPKRVNQTAIARQTKKVNGKNNAQGQPKQTQPQFSNKKKPAVTKTPKAKPQKPLNDMAATSTIETCPDCGASVVSDSNVCPSCHHIFQRPKGIGRKTFKIKHPVGMHLWLAEHAFSGVSMKTVKLTVHIFIALFFLFLTTTAFIVFNLRTAGLVLGLSALLAIPYMLMVWRCHVVCHNLSVRLSWWQKIFWNSVLTFARSRNWPHESDTTALHKRIVLDLRKNPVDDNSIRTLEQLPQAAVLDLSGSAITDQGAQVLHHLINLQCLVLKGTKVSKDEVARLQISLPRCWIWV